MKPFIGKIIFGLLASLCVLGLYNLYSIFTEVNSSFWGHWYKQAVFSRSDFWQIGYRLENLESGIEFISNKLSRSLSTNSEISSANLRISKDFFPNYQHLNHIADRHHAIFDISSIFSYNLSNVFVLRCAKDEYRPIRVGINDFRSDIETACHLYNGSPEDISGKICGPHYMFERVPLDQGSFALRSIATGRYLQVVPYQKMQNSREEFEKKMAKEQEVLNKQYLSEELQDIPLLEEEKSKNVEISMDESLSVTWELSVGSTVPGATSRLRMVNGNLFSSALEGFLECGNNHFVRGYKDVFYSDFEPSFKLDPVLPDMLTNALEYVSLSNQILQMQHSFDKPKPKQSRGVLQNAGEKDKISSVVRICIAMPVTSKGTVMDGIENSPIWTNFFQSFIDSIDWRSNKYEYAIYVGVDKYDKIYDTETSKREFQKFFHHFANVRLHRQRLDHSAIDMILSKMLTLNIIVFAGLQGAPSQIVSQLVLAAYVKDFDYFYQVNDDTVIITPNWAATMIKTLENNPVAMNLGVTGPLDLNNDRIFTHAFVHRTHIDIFGTLFPKVFQNWWSDDWISTVYGDIHTFRNPNVRIRHNVESQKSDALQRYDVDFAVRRQLEDQLRIGYVMIDKWLKNKNLKRLELPNICGYIPLSIYVAEKLRHSNQSAHALHISD